MKYKLLILFLIFILFPSVLFAQSETEKQEEEVFRAKVVEVVEQKSEEREDGSISIQQKLKLKCLDGSFEGEEIEFDGTYYDLVSSPEYKTGDKVLVSYTKDIEGGDNFYVVDYVRQGTIYWLLFLFAIIVMAVGKIKGFRALIALVLTFFIILKFIVPKILAGSDPLFISIIGSFFILIFAIYITEGFKRTSTVAVVSILISLFVTGILSVWFTEMTKLTGFASEEAGYLIGIAGGNINIKGLLLAGIIIGTLGVLDDIIISQVALVRELKISNPNLPDKKTYSKAMKVGVSHLSSMVNTLFLAYAGAALPLLILFGVKRPPFVTFSQVINNEVIATEIVRTLTGSIGIVLAVPLATFLAVKFVKEK